MKKRKIIVVVMSLFIMSLTACKSDDYKAALEYYDDGEYAKAYEILSELGNYKESAVIAKECKEEMNKIENENAYEYANNIFALTGAALTVAQINNQKVTSNCYKITLSKDKGIEMICNNGTNDDICSNFIDLANDKGNLPQAGYGIVFVDSKTYAVKSAYFCTEDCFGDNFDSFDKSKADENYIVKGYPKE